MDKIDKSLFSEVLNHKLTECASSIEIEYIDDYFTRNHIPDYMKDTTKTVGLDDTRFIEWMKTNILKTMNKVQIASFFNQIERALFEANVSLDQSVLTKSGNINLNANLHGFIFEEVHAATFNANAKLAGKGNQIRAIALKPNPGHTYAANSVDIRIQRYDLKTNKWVNAGAYQAKCCKTPDATIKSFANGSYGNQKYLVPKGYESEVRAGVSSRKSVSECIEFDGITSTPISYENTVKLANAKQAGEFSELGLEHIDKDTLIQSSIHSVLTGIFTDALVRTVFLSVEHLFGQSSKSFSEDVIENAKGLSIDSMKIALTETVEHFIECGKLVLPECMVELSAGTRTCFIYESISFILDACIVLYSVHTGKQNQVEATAAIIKSAIVTLSAMIGTGIGAASGTGPLGTAFGGFLGTFGGNKLIGWIGEENITRFAEYSIETWDIAKEQIEFVKSQLHEKVQEITKEEVFALT